ncbi:MAG: NAD(P)/FAD-dependent oxidoreductase [Clostridiales bacterium]|nr:NAD(P)/FAD-dependent oxidoreductase [Clostridiales bacterium]
MNKETDVLIIGGGPAGLLAAIRAARMGARVVLVEKNKQIGRKLRITGKGRCNITNNKELQPFIREYGEKGKFLYSAFSRFFHQDIRRLLEEAGVETKEERGGRVFPVSDRAADVAEALEKLARGAGVEIILDCKVQGLILEAVDGVRQFRVAGVTLYDAWDTSEIRAKAVIVATGGMSYPLTGSTGDGYVWAREVGHSVTALSPALVPLESQDAWVSALSGLTLKNVKASLWAAPAKADTGGESAGGEILAIDALDAGSKADEALEREAKAGSGQARKLAEFQGEMLFAHFGLTGPVILSLSRFLQKDWTAYHVQIDLKPALSEEVLDKRLQRDFLRYQRKQLVNAMVDLLPRALIPVVISQAGLEESQPIATLTRAQRWRMIRTLKALQVSICGTRPIEEAIVTVGGVDLSEIDPKTMASKKVAGLYFAGELLDIDGYTGGYNLQAAFSTGWTAGEYAAKQA